MLCRTVFENDAFRGARARNTMASRTRSWTVLRATSWVVRPATFDASSVSMVLARTLFERLANTATGSGRMPE